jgi:hypothetical protein
MGHRFSVAVQNRQRWLYPSQSMIDQKLDKGNDPQKYELVFFLNFIAEGVVPSAMILLSLFHSRAPFIQSTKLVKNRNGFNKSAVDLSASLDYSPYAPWSSANPMIRFQTRG